MTSKFNVGDRVKTDYGIGTVKSLPRFATHLHAVELDVSYWPHDCDGITKAAHGAWTSESCMKLVDPSKPTIKVVVGSHVRHLEHPEYGNGRVRFLHPNGISLAVEFENATGLDHDCAGHTKVNHGRWTKAESLELVNKPFKVGDTVLICAEEARFLPRDGGCWYAKDFAGQQGTITGTYSDKFVNVRAPFGRGFSDQYVHINDLTLVKVDPVEAVKKATPKVRTFKKGSQCDRIVKFLLAGNSITPLKARQLFGAERLAARILEIRQAGHKVVATVKTDLNGKVYGEYSLRNVGRVWA